VIKYLKYDKGLPYYRRRVPADLVRQVGEKEIVIRLHEKNGSLEGQCHRWGDLHTAMFERLRINPESGVISRPHIDALLSKHGTRAGIGLNPLPVSQNPGHQFSETPHADDFLTYYSERKESGRLTPLDEAALAALRDGYPSLLSDAKRIYLEDPREGKWRQTSTAYWNKLIAFKGDMQLEAFDRQLAKEYMNKRLKEGAKTQTVQKELNIFNAGFTKAFIELGILTKNNPFLKLSPDNLGKDATKKSTLTPDQIKKYLQLLQANTKTSYCFRWRPGLGVVKLLGLEYKTLTRRMAH